MKKIILLSIIVLMFGLSLVTAEVTCVESDNGLDYLTFGEIEFSNGSIVQDQCNPYHDKRLLEKSCNITTGSGYAFSVEIYCEEEYGEGATCIDGACIIPEEEETESSEFGESDSEEQEEIEKGTVIVSATATEEDTAFEEDTATEEDTAIEEDTVTEEDTVSEEEVPCESDRYCKNYTGKKNAYCNDEGFCRVKSRLGGILGEKFVAKKATVGFGAAEAEAGIFEKLWGWLIYGS
jgi:hypothetical protein